MSIGRGRGVKTDINVTPLIDVVLVLLIIFLVTMPKDCVAQGSPLVLTIRADLSVSLNDGGKETTVPGTDLARALRHATEGKALDRPVFVDVEDPVPWRDVVAAMDTARGVDASVALKVRPGVSSDVAPGQGQ